MHQSCHANLKSAPCSSTRCRERSRQRLTTAGGRASVPSCSATPAYTRTTLTRWLLCLVLRAPAHQQAELRFLPLHPSSATRRHGSTLPCHRSHAAVSRHRQTQSQDLTSAMTSAAAVAQPQMLAQQSAGTMLGCRHPAERRRWFRNCGGWPVSGAYRVRRRPRGALRAPGPQHCPPVMQRLPCSGETRHQPQDDCLLSLASRQLRAVRRVAGSMAGRHQLHQTLWPQNCGH